MGASGDGGKPAQSGLVDMGTSQTVGRFWTADYIDAWTSLQNQVAVHVDGAPDSALGVGAVQNLGDGATLAQLSPAAFQLTSGTGQSVTVTSQGDYLDWSWRLVRMTGPNRCAVWRAASFGAAQGPDTTLQNPTALTGGVHHG